MTRHQAREYRKKIEHAAQTQTDSDALESIELFPVWKPNAVIEIKNGEWWYDGQNTHIQSDNKIGLRLKHNEKLVRVRQAHTTSENWIPLSVGTESLYDEVVFANDGEDAQHPISYNGNMELFNGKYYSQDGVVYLCNRDSGAALHNALKDLVGLYVIVV